MEHYRIITAYITLIVLAFLGIYDYWVETHWGDPATISKVILGFDLKCKLFAFWFALWMGIGTGHFFFMRQPNFTPNFIYDYRLIFVLLLGVVTITTCCLDYFAEVRWGNTGLFADLLAWIGLHCQMLALVLCYWAGMEISHFYLEQSF